MPHYILMPAGWFKILPANRWPGPPSDFACIARVQVEIGYHERMRNAASIRVFMLAVLLAASQVVFASHVSSHVDFKAGHCEWCVCHVQTLAGPLPSAEPVNIERLRAPLKPAGEIAILSQPVAPGYQPRAPPISS